MPAKNNYSTSVKMGVILVGIGLFYVLFPTQNSTLDAYSYAGYIRYFQNIFTPHHLLYNLFMYLIYKAVYFFNTSVDVLALTKFVNSIFAVLNLFVFYKILGRLKLPEKEIILFVLVLGFSFSPWRFGTENENYIVPIFFSLWASYFLIMYLQESRNLQLFLSGFTAAVACLFHQIHFFWWLGLLVGVWFYRKNLQSLILYGISALWVVLAYSLVLVYYEHQSLNITNMYHFVFHDLIAGSVMTNFGWKGVFFQVLNSFRTFFQLHPTMFYLIRKHFLFVLPLLLGLYLAYRFFRLLFRKQLFVKKTPEFPLLVKVHIGIFIANFLFAFYNYGNVEFMVMLPYLLFIIFAFTVTINTRFLTLTAVTLFIWNFSYAIFPNYHYNYYNDEALVDYIIQNPDKTFIVKNPDVINRNYYRTGIDNEARIIPYYRMDQAAIEQILHRRPIYTDLLEKPVILNKEQMTQTQNIDSILATYHKEKVFSYSGFYGQTTVYKITD